MDTFYAKSQDVSSRTFPVHHAARRRDVQKLSELIACGWSVNEFTHKESGGTGYGTPLWYAASGPEPGGVAVAELLVRAGARVNDRCEKGRTALHVAAVWGKLDMVLYLLHHGADPTLTDEDGRTPSQLAREMFESAQQQRKSGILDSRLEEWFSHVPAVIAILEVDRAEITASRY